jgi:hypothetical protein
MLESHLHGGNNRFPTISQLKYGVSVSDACVDWSTTAECCGALPNCTTCAAAAAGPHLEGSGLLAVHRHRELRPSQPPDRASAASRLVARVADGLSP